jgi:hypothetical protein
MRKRILTGDWPRLIQATGMQDVVTGNRQPNWDTRLQRKPSG